MATQTQYYNLDKPSYDEVADIEIINANFDKIDQQMRNNADGVNFAKAISSDAYDNSKLYAVGDYCIYDNKLYRCITAIESAESFNIAKWEQTTVGKEVAKLKNDLYGRILEPQIIPYGANLDDYTESGIYIAPYDNGCTNIPSVHTPAHEFYLEVIKYNENMCMHVFRSRTGNVLCQRAKHWYDGSYKFSNWYSFQATML